MSSMDISTYNNKPSKFDPNAKMSEKEIRAKEKESFKGLNFKELSHEFGPKDNDAGMHSDVVKGGQDQLLFAQKLLLKQLQCQTPDSSVDPNKMLDAMMGMLTIAQNSEMVKMQKQNMELQKALFYTSFSSFEGEVVEHTGNEFDYNDQDQEIVFNLPAKIDKAELIIFNKHSNEMVRIVDLDKKAGRNSFIWDGKAQNGINCPKGIYKIFITAHDDEGKSVEVNTRLKSHITEIAYDENELAILMSGRIPIYDIKRRTMTNKATQRYEEVAAREVKKYQDNSTQTSLNSVEDITQRPMSSGTSTNPVWSLPETNITVV